MSMPEKEHWSRHPLSVAVLSTLLTYVLGNAAAIFAVVHFALVVNIPLFVLIWLVSAFLTFVAGWTMPIYAVVALFSKETRKNGYWRFLIAMYPHLTRVLFESITEKTRKPHAHTQEDHNEETSDQAQDHDQK